MKEARITINGVELSEGQSLTVRVALESFLMEIATNGLGDDAHGKTMAGNYTARGLEVRALMIPPENTHAPETL